MQPAQDSPIGLLRVDQREDGVAQIHRLARLRVHVVERLEGVDAVVDEGQQPLVGDVAPEFELRDGLDAAGRAGVADHEHGVAALHPGLAPAEEALAGVERIAVLVDAQEGEVEGVARVGEIVGVAAEVADGQLGRHHHAHVGVAPEDVGRGASAVVERDHLHFEAGVLAPVLLGDAGRDLLLGRCARLRAGLRFVDALQGRVHLRGHVANRDEPVGFELLDRPLFVQALRVEPVVQQALSLAGHRGYVLTRAMVVGEYQPIPRHEGRRAAGDAQRSQPGAAEPDRVGVDVVRLAQVVGGRVLEGPHAPVVEAAGAHGVEAGDWGGATVAAGGAGGAGVSASMTGSGRSGAGGSVAIWGIGAAPPPHASAIRPARA